MGKCNYLVLRPRRNAFACPKRHKGGVWILYYTGAGHEDNEEGVLRIALCFAAKMRHVLIIDQHNLSD